MLICVSPNPALDKRLRIPKLLPGGVNRAVEARPAPGGKAAHVAMVLRELGADPLWVGITGGASGQALLEGLHEMEINTRAVPVRNSTRTNLEILEDDGAVTEILEPGPDVSLAESDHFQERCSSVFGDSRSRVTAVLSGSLPPGAPREIFSRLIEDLHKFEGKAYLDTSGEPLKIALEARPDFVKPNREEAEWLTGSRITEPASAARCISHLVAAGAKSAAISLGANGLVWLPAENEPIYYAHPLHVPVRSCVGSGDATTAAFAFAAETGLLTQETLRLAAACGAANCLADAPGRVKAADIRNLQKEVRIETLS
jgi:tagatose 6-phosphate kinase